MEYRGLNCRRLKKKDLGKVLLRNNGAEDFSVTSDLTWGKLRVKDRKKNIRKEREPDSQTAMAKPIKKNS